MADKRITAAGILLTDSQHGIGMAPSRTIKPVWGQIVAIGPYDDAPNYFEWREVYPDKDGNWRQYAVDEPDKAARNDSILVENLLYNPAVEINGHGDIPLGTVVRLIPTRHFYSGPDSISHRAWLFSSPQTMVRPFRLQRDLIPTGGAELDNTILAEWLDKPGTPVLLYPTHQGGFPTDDNFLSHGIGRGPGAYFRGTYGWAKYNAQGTAYTAADGTTKYRGEWQIITLYAETVATAIVYGAAIDPGDVGEAQLWWIDKNQEAPTLINSTYQIDVFNDLLDTLQVGDRIKVYFDRNSYVWRPITGSTSTRWCKVTSDAFVPAGNGKASRVVTARHCDWDGGNAVAVDLKINTLVHPTLDTALFDGDVFEYCVADDGTLVSRGDIYDDPIGTVKMWNKAVGLIRPGWRVCGAAATTDMTGAGGRVPKQRDGAELINAQGGSATHTHIAHTNVMVANALANHNNHANHAAMAHDNNHSWASAAAPAAAGADLDLLSHSNHTPDAHDAHSAHAPAGGADTTTHDNPSNQQPWTAVEFIERFE